MLDRIQKINLKLFLFFVIIILLSLNYFLLSVYLNRGNNSLKVVFLDVGQGDAIFIKSPSGHKILIDAGASGAELLSALSRELYFWERDFDIVFATHADKDHIGGFIDFLKSYRVKYVAMPRLKSKGTELSESLLYNLAKQKNLGVKELYPKRGDIFDFGDSFKIYVYYPGSKLYFKDSNLNSLTLKLVYGKTNFLLSGDLPGEAEKVLALYDRGKLKSDVLKLGHHGSKTSSAWEFLKTVSPKFAVVSAAKNNNYGHPHGEIIKRVQDLGARILYTWDGNLVFESDGESVFVK